MSFISLVVDPRKVLFAVITHFQTEVPSCECKQQGSFEPGNKKDINSQQEETKEQNRFRCVFMYTGFSAVAAKGAEVQAKEPLKRKGEKIAYIENMLCGSFHNS